MKSRLLILFLIYFLLTYKINLAQQPKIKIYFIHGQGSDSRIFSKIKINENFDTAYLNLPMPDKSDNMQSFAKQLIPKIDTTQAFVLIGVSLGGMVASELHELIHPALTIIISSAKNSNELPQRYKFMKTIPIYKIFPAGLIKSSSFIMQPLVEPDRRLEKELFKSMLQKKDKHFLKKTIPLIVKWDKKDNKGTGLHHIHGNKDHTIPSRNVKNALIIPKGSHMMTLTCAEIISEKINEQLRQLIDTKK